MVKGRRVKVKPVVAFARNDDCYSPNPKRRDQKIPRDTTFLHSDKTNTITEFFQNVGEIKELKDIIPLCYDELMSNNEDDDISCKNMTYQDSGPPTPHRIELYPCEDAAKEKPKPKAPKLKKRQDNHKLTDYFPVRRSVRKTKKIVLEEKQRSLEQLLRNEIEDGLEVRIFEDKGRGVVASKPFTKGDFVVEYSGDLIDLNEAKKRELRYAQDLNTGCYMYYFKHNDQQYCVDATAESGKLGRLVNHSRNGNLITRTVSVDNKPRLVLIAKDDIKEGDEITYDYGDRSKESLKHHPWLAY